MTGLRVFVKDNRDVFHTTESCAVLIRNRHEAQVGRPNRVLHRANLLTEAVTDERYQTVTIMRQVDDGVDGVLVEQRRPCAFCKAHLGATTTAP